jgi:hypothetical protein
MGVANSEEWPFKLYRFNLHVHTIKSQKARHLDWPDKTTSIFDLTKYYDHTITSSPAETCDLGKKLNLSLGLCDHDCSLNSKDWDEIKTTCETKSDENQMFLGGYEWTAGDFQHISVFGTRTFVSAASMFVGYGLTGQDKKFQLITELFPFYRWLADQAKIDPFAFGQFNHSKYSVAHFNNFEMPLDCLGIKEFMALFEVRSGPAIKFTTIAENEYLYVIALQKGWWLAPTIGIDNFGNITEEGAKRYHTGVWIDKSFPGTNQEQAKMAFIERRTFASEDKDFILKYWAKAEDDPRIYYLGDRINLVKNKMVTLFLNLTDETNKINSISAITVKKNNYTIYSNYPVNFSKNSHSLNICQQFVLSPDTIGVYFKIVLDNKDTIISAPIGFNWHDPVKEIKYDYIPTGNKEKDEALKWLSDFNNALMALDKFSIEIIPTKGIKRPDGKIVPGKPTYLFELGKDIVYLTYRLKNPEVGKELVFEGITPSKVFRFKYKMVKDKKEYVFFPTLKNSAERGCFYINIYKDNILIKSASFVVR